VLEVTSIGPTIEFSLQQRSFAAVRIRYSQKAFLLSEKGSDFVTSLIHDDASINKR
jgi:hypothetical protein